MVNDWNVLGCCPDPRKLSGYPRLPRPQSYNSPIITEPPRLFEPPRLTSREIPPVFLEPLLSRPRPTRPPISRRPRVVHQPIPQPAPVLYPLPLPRVHRLVPRLSPPPPLTLHRIPLPTATSELIPFPSPRPILLPIKPPSPHFQEPELQLVPYISPSPSKSCLHDLTTIHFRPQTPPLECPFHPRLIPLLPCPFHPHHFRSCPQHWANLPAGASPSNMPFGNSYPRSAPGTPFENIFRTHDNDAILRDVQARFLGTADYFSPNPDIRRAGLHAAAALHPGYPVEDAVRLNDIRTINVSAQIANSTVTPKMLYAEVHPKFSTIDGRYPRDFEIPYRLGDIIEADTVTLDRILAHYDIRDPSFSSNSSSSNLFFSRNHGRDSDRNREDKLYALLQYLGVNVDSESVGRGGLGAGLRSRNSGSGLGGKNGSRDESEIGRAIVDAVGDNVLKAITNGATERGSGLGGRRQPRLGARSRDSSPRRN